MNTTEDRLKNVLGEHGNDVRISVADLADHAIARDKRNRRRELTAMAGTAALALAVAAPIVVNLGGTRQTAPAPADTVHTTVTTSVTTAPTSAPSTALTSPMPSSPSTVTSSTTPATVPYAELAHAWAAGDKLHIGGKTIQLERGTIVTDFAVLANGGVVLQSRMGTTDPREIEILDAQGHPVRSFKGDLVDWVASPDGTRVLVSDGTTLTAYDETGKQLAKRADTRSAMAIVGDVAYASVFHDGKVGSLQWNVATGSTRELARDITAVAADGKVAAARWNGTPKEVVGDVTCWGVLDLAEPDQMQFEKCDSHFLPIKFSADGRYLLGDEIVDGGDVRNLSIRSAQTGTLVFGGGTKPNWFLSWTMRLAPDGETVLVSKMTETTPAGTSDDLYLGELQQCSLDGECQTLQPEKRSEAFGSGYFVVAR